MRGKLIAVSPLTIECILMFSLKYFLLYTRESGSHKGLSPCDFDLIPKMKEPLRGIRFRTLPEILQAVDRFIRTINTTGAAKGILRLHIAGNGLFTMLVTTLKKSKTSKHVSVLYQL